MITRIYNSDIGNLLQVFSTATAQVLIDHFVNIALHNSAESS